jgi:hypothetical protein
MSDAAALRPHLKAAHFPQKTVLYDVGETFKTVYFPTTAIVSLVVSLATGEMTESAMVGRDGAIGTASAFVPLAVARPRFVGKRSPCFHPGIFG